MGVFQAATPECIVPGMAEFELARRRLSACVPETFRCKARKLGGENNLKTSDELSCIPHHTCEW